MRRDNETFRRVVAEDQLPSRFPIGWVLAFWIMADKLDNQLAWWIFWTYAVVTLIVYTIRVWTEVQVEVIDPKIKEQ